MASNAVYCLEALTEILYFKLLLRAHTMGDSKHHMMKKGVLLYVKLLFI